MRGAATAGRGTGRARHRELGWRLYERLPASGDRLIQAAQRYLLPLLRPRLPLRQVRGTTADGQRSSALIAGGGATIDYLLERLFAAPPETESLGKVLLWSLPAVLGRDTSDDLVLVQIQRPLARWLFDDRWLRVPEALDMRLRIDASDPLKAANRAIRRDAGRIRGSELTWTVSRDLGAFERFYDEFYRPHARARFGERALIRARPVLRRKFRRGGVLWVWLGERAVAGHLVQVDGAVLRLVAMGSRADANQQMRRDRLMATGYLFALDYGQARGVSELDLGGCLPSLRDGVVAHKRAWGARLEDRSASSHDVLVRWPRFSQPVARFLADVPLIFRRRDRFAAITALGVDQPTPVAAARKLWSQLAPDGLDGMYVVAGEPPDPAEADPFCRGAAPVWLAAPGPPETILASARRV